MLAYGGVAQLGERLPCTQEVIGSIPFTSTIFLVVMNKTAMELQQERSSSLFVFF